MLSKSIINKNENHFTPLRIAIQKYNIEEIKILYALEKTHRYLSDYDQAVINSIIFGKKNAFKELMNPTHSELCSCIQSLYAINPHIVHDGVCFGITQMRQQTLFSGTVEVFNRQLNNIKYNLWPIIEAAIAEVRNKGLSPATDLRGFCIAVRMQLHKKFPYEIWYNTYAFFDGVILYNTPDLIFPEYLNIKRISLRQNSYPAANILSHTYGACVHSNYVFSGNYTEPMLVKYFKCLDQALKSFNDQVGFVIYTENHVFIIDYNNGKWRYTNANNLKSSDQEYSHSKMVQLFLKDVAAPHIFTTQPLIKPASIDAFNKTIAILKQDIEWIKLHEKMTIKQYLQPNANKYTLFYIAAASGDLETIKRGLHLGINCTSLIEPQSNSLYIAAHNGHLEIVKELLKKMKYAKSEINKPTHLGFTALFIAAKHGNLEIVEELVKALGNDKWEINKSINNSNRTPLYIAIKNGYLNIVKVLLNALINDAQGFNQPIKIDSNVLMEIALLNNYHDIFQELIMALPDSKEIIKKPTNTGETMLYIAVKRSYFDIVKILLHALKGDKKSINTSINNGLTALGLATQQNSLAVVAELISALENDPEEIYKPMTNGMTALMFATMLNNIDIVKALLSTLKDGNTTINHPNIHGLTALYIAARYGFAPIVKELIEHGADVNLPIKTNTHNSLVNSTQLNKEMVFGLLMNEHDINYHLPGFTPLHVAVYFGHNDVVKLLHKDDLQFTNSSQGVSVYALIVAINRIYYLPSSLQEKYLTEKSQVNTKQELFFFDTKEQNVGTTTTVSFKFAQ